VEEEIEVPEKPLRNAHEILCAGASTQKRNFSMNVGCVGAVEVDKR
jgi:hypothetical protein